MKFSFGQKPEGPEIPEGGASDITSADIPTPRGTQKNIDIDFERANSKESERAFLAALESVKDVFDKRNGVHLVQKINGKNFISSEGLNILRSELNKRIQATQKQFEAWLIDQANIEAYENSQKKDDSDEGGEVWKA